MRCGSQNSSQQCQFHKSLYAKVLADTPSEFSQIFDQFARETNHCHEDQIFYTIIRNVNINTRDRTQGSGVQAMRHLSHVYHSLYNHAVNGYMTFVLVFGREGSITRYSKNIIIVPLHATVSYHVTPELQHNITLALLPKTQVI